QLQPAGVAGIIVLQLKALALCDAERVNVLLDAAEDLLSRHRGASLRGRVIEGTGAARAVSSARVFRVASLHAAVTSQLRGTGCKMRRSVVSDDSAEAAVCPPGSSVVLIPRAGCSGLSGRSLAACLCDRDVKAGQRCTTPHG